MPNALVMQHSMVIACKCHATVVAKKRRNQETKDRLHADDGMLAFVVTA